MLAGKPGQFVMATLPAFSAAPISVSRFRPDGLDLTIRAAGPATRAFTSLERGETLGLRGPLGRGWPVAALMGHDVVIVAGGIGLAPLRPLIDACLTQRDQLGAVRLYLGARTPADRLFVAEIGRSRRPRRTWRSSRPSIAPGPEWLGRVGIVTQLFDRATWDGRDAVAFICGPERMMQATADVLSGRGIDQDRTWVTLERNMACGVGLCGHCQLGRFFVCRDGPVFSLAELGRGVHHGGTVMARTARRDAARRPRVGVVKFASCDGCQLTDPGPRGRAARDHRAVRHRGVPGGDVTPVRRPIRRPARGRLHQHRGAAGGAAASPPRGHDAGDHRRLCHRGRHPGHPQLVRSRAMGGERVSQAGRWSQSLATSTPIADHVAVDAELRGCPIDPGQLLELLTALWWWAGVHSCPTSPCAPSASGAARHAWSWPRASRASDP